MGSSSADVEVRERVLAVAGDLFYQEGLHRVPLQRVIEDAGVPADEVLQAFGGEDGLVLAYLRARHVRVRETIDGGLAAYNSPRDRLIGVFELQGRMFREPSFRGCAFVAASARAHRGKVVELVAREFRNWLHNLFFGLAFEAEALYPEQLAQQLVVLYDGGAITAWMDRRPSTDRATTALAASLVDAALVTQRA